MRELANLLQSNSYFVYLSVYVVFFLNFTVLKILFIYICKISLNEFQHVAENMTPKHFTLFEFWNKCTKISEKVALVFQGVCYAGNIAIFLEILLSYFTPPQKKITRKLLAMCNLQFTVEFFRMLLL